MKFRKAPSKPASLPGPRASRAPRTVPGRPHVPEVPPRRWSLLLPHGFERK
ncbi:MAG: hypothetical protein QOG59_1598 [Solirubrobacteraceae bacterium]|nr:hypothetical protein [Solirubrobacteraceae bacterium]